MPYYRTNNVSLMFRNMDDLTGTLDIMKRDIQDLVDALKLVDDTSVMEEDVYE